MRKAQWSRGEGKGFLEERKSTSTSSTGSKTGGGACSCPCPCGPGRPPDGAGTSGLREFYSHLFKGGDPVSPWQVMTFMGSHITNILVPPPGTEPAPSAVEEQSPNHWTASEEVPR